LSADELASARRALDSLALAVTFLTIAPAPVHGRIDLGRAAAWFPAVGAVIGALAGGVCMGAEPVV
jgi:cobalamin synthase